MDEYLKYAIKASEIAKKILLKYYKKTTSYNIKDGAGLVTVADTESENAIKKYLTKNTPNFAILAEESGENFKSNTKWIIDPLDGTTNFYHGFPFFCVSIALEYNGEIVIGVVNNPVNNDLYFTKKGSGAFKNKKRIYVSNNKTLENAFIGTGFAYMKDKDLRKALVIFENISNICHGVRRPGSAVLDLCMVAQGVYDAFYEETLNPWDTAAGTLLVKEAGGTVTNFNGNDFSIYDNTVLASNSKIHKEIANILKN